MKIYKDIFSNDELLADTFPMELIDGVVFKVKGKLKSERVGIDDSLIGGNASAEGGDEGCDDSAVISGVNIVLNHNLVASPMKKKDYMKVIKKYMSKVKQYLKENSPDELPMFEKNIAKFVKGVLDNFDDYEPYIGESYHEDSMLPLMQWDGETPYMFFFKHGLLEEKV